MKRIVGIIGGHVVFNPERAVCIRTKKIRLAAGFDDIEEFTKQLNISVDEYLEYEEYTPLPHFLIPDFCLLTKAHPWRLLSDEPVPDFLK